MENEGVKIPSTVRWLSAAASSKARYNGKIITASSVASPLRTSRSTDRSAEEDCVSRDAAITWRPTRRSGQTWDVVTALGGATLSQSATGRMRVVGGAPVDTPRRNIDAWWRGAVLERATGGTHGGEVRQLRRPPFRAG